MKNYNKVHNSNEPTTDTPKEQKPEKNRAKVLAKRLNVRSNPDIDSDILDTISEGKKLLINGEDNDEWTPVLIHDGVKGYVMSKFVERVD